MTNKERYSKIRLTKIDYKFIDNFMKDYRLPDGKGYRIIIERFINEYKKERKK